jgi:hypothetical protein
MPKWMKTVLAGNVVLIVLVFIAVAHAQRPAEKDSEGVDYLRVNINPTNVPPMVNINPNGGIPRVDLNQMPEVHVAPAGCQNRQNFMTGVGQNVLGPFIVTYLQLAPQVMVTLTDGTRSHSLNLGQAGQISTAIYLRAGQGLYFDSDVLYSGCRPD